MTDNSDARFLVRLQRQAVKAVRETKSLQLSGATLDLEPLFEHHRLGASFSFQPLAQWFLATPRASTEGTGAWELAHQSAAIEIAGAMGTVYIEPDLIHEWPYVNATPMLEEGLAGRWDVQLCQFNDQDPALPIGPEFAWHLRDDFSQLRAARAAARASPDPYRVRIAHIDTGYDPTHQSKPRHLRLSLQRSFVDGEPSDNAADPAKRGFLKNPGHGTGTLSILAGNKVAPFGDYLGGAPEADVIPIRIAKSVVLIRTSALARALDYILAPGGDPANRVDVVSLSMGGLASRAWTEAVNRAYEAGICIVAAAGNNFSGLPTRFIVYPARYRRVIAACGVMANGRPYYGLPAGTMQGNYGPRSKMATAIAAYTPNMAWAELGCPGIVDHDGQGTSSATPQVAAAAALWLSKYNPTHPNEPWQRVEAVRHAMFTSAHRAGKDIDEYFGNGILRARDALDVAPPAELQETPRDTAWFPFLRVLTGLGLAEDPARSSMFAVEATQLAQRIQAVESLLPDPDLPADLIPRPQLLKVLDAIIGHENASPALKTYLKAQARDSSRVFVPSPPSPRPTKPTQPSRPRAAPPAGRSQHPPPPKRLLRGYAFDPALSLRFDTAVMNQATFALPWEPLEPGPVGEYIEVVDYDPASQCFYPPVDLDDPHVLAQNGLPPSDGNPQFHQQMTYAVAMLTVRHFERALGRLAFWAPGPGEDEFDDSHYVRRLRIYPHALRQANAYYSPAKKALLFGYFPAVATNEEHLPGGTVFTCLSHDIVAHETTHALLDGMHRRFSRPTNPDVLAFHEAFADLVALFQHFTFSETLRHQIAQTRGNLRAESFLGQLAWEFGRAIGNRDALRSAIGTKKKDGTWEITKPDPSALESTEECHDRGAILVAAVFDAFVSIYESRVADLYRLATGGTGELPAGAIHPDLVNRLADEASKSASHVLTMCIRALDYCPPLDLTFGEYLRALITADHDLVADDDRGYRIAFIEAFRRRGIYPLGVRTLSIDSLLWRPPDQDETGRRPQLGGVLSKLRTFAHEHAYTTSRERLFFLTRNARANLHDWLMAHFEKSRSGAADAKCLGLDPAIHFEVHSLRLSHRVGPDGNSLPQVLVELTQSKDLEIQPDGGGSGPPEVMRFEGGCTMIVDLLSFEIRYCIRKDINSDTRATRQQAFQSRPGLRPLRGTYFSSARWGGLREPFALLHGRNERTDDHE